MISLENQKVISAFYQRISSPVCEKYGLTQMEYNILMFLSGNPQHDTAAEITKIRLLTKSHVSVALKQLEQKALVKRTHLDSNRKTVHLSLTAAAQPIIAEGLSVQTAFRSKLFQDFSDAELEQFRILFSRICGNARVGLDSAVMWK